MRQFAVQDIKNSGRCSGTIPGILVQSIDFLWYCSSGMEAS